MWTHVHWRATVGRQELKGEGSKKERRTMVTLDYHLCAFGGMMMDEDEKFEADARAAPKAQKEAD
jgi:hypothetical protein